MIKLFAGLCLCAFADISAALPKCERDSDAMSLVSKAETLRGEEALTLYKQAADLGHASAMHTIGLIYVSGRGVTVDYEKAYSWFSKAAKLGQHNSMFSLGIMNAEGEGRPVDMVTSYAWYSLAGDYIPKNMDEWFMPRFKVAMYQRADNRLSAKMSETDVEKGELLKAELEKSFICSWYHI